MTTAAAGNGLLYVLADPSLAVHLTVTALSVGAGEAGGWLGASLHRPSGSRRRRRLHALRSNTELYEVRT
ncbi:MAG: hypothetical protein ACLFWM_09740 [Actinomycetota bacterium]